MDGTHFFVRLFSYYRRAGMLQEECEKVVNVHVIIKT